MQMYVKVSFFYKNSIAYPYSLANITTFFEMK